MLGSDLGQKTRSDLVCCTIEGENLSLQVSRWKNFGWSWVLVQQVVDAAPLAGTVVGRQCLSLAMQEDEEAAQDSHKDFVEAVDLEPIAAVEGRTHQSVSRLQEAGCGQADQWDMVGLKALGGHFHCSENKLLEDIPDPLDSVDLDSENVGAGNVVVQGDHCSALMDSLDLDTVLV